MPGDWMLGLEQPTCGIDKKPCKYSAPRCDTCEDKLRREKQVKGVNTILSLERGRIDKDSLIRIWHSVGWFTGSATTPERLLQAIHNSDLVISVWDKDEDKLVGVCMTITNGLQVYITHCAVEKAYHGFGLGGKMLEMVKEHYNDHEVLVDTSRAKTFYEQHGFDICERDTMRYDSRVRQTESE